MKNPSITITAIILLFCYLGSYAWFYAHKSPAANLAYFVYLRDGNEKQERLLFNFYYPVYKTHTYLGSMRHNRDRPAARYDGL